MQKFLDLPDHHLVIFFVTEQKEGKGKRQKESVFS